MNSDPDRVRRRLLALLPAAALLGACGKAGVPTSSAANAGIVSGAAPDLSKVKLVLGDQVNLLRTTAEAAGVL